MAKRKKRMAIMAPSLGSPSPGEQRKWAAKSMAHTIMDTDPSHRRVEDAITKAVMAAGEKALKSARRGK